MVTENALMKIRNGFADGSRSSARPGPSADARNITNEIQTARSADRASIRPAAGSRVGTAVATVIAAAALTTSDTPAASTLTQPTQGRYGRTSAATRTATSGGVNMRIGIIETIAFAMMKSPPASRKASYTFRASSFAAPQPQSSPRVIVPSAASETRSPLLPKSRYRI